MAKPALLAVDDDPEVLRAVARDLKREYGERYRVLQADSGAAGLEVLKGLKLRNTPLALLLADQRMPRMSGVEFLAQAAEFFPDAKRVLLTAYADTEAAIRAINSARVDFYLLKPWDPPEENLYPVLTDLLDDWQAGFHPPFEGIRIIGHRWSPEAHNLKEFLARNCVPYRWLDVEAGEEAKRLLEETGLGGAKLPLAILPDGAYLEGATAQEVAQRVGLKTRAEMPFYQLIIVGAGPSGLAAAVYGASEGLSTLLVESEAPGGQAGQSARIENYLGFPSGLSGSDLARRATAQARKFKAEILCPQEVREVRIDGPYRRLVLADQSELSCHALLIASGVSYRRLNVPGAEELAGAGVYYGIAAAEAINYQGQDVFIVGGGNSAGQAAMYLSRYARQVTVLVRGSGLAESMSRYLIDQLGETPNIAVRTRTEVAEVLGKDHLEELVLRHRDSGETQAAQAAALFIFIGAVPRTDWLTGVIERDARGFIPTGSDLKREGRWPKEWPLERDPFLLETSVPGIFAAGDVRQGSVKRVASGVGEGAMAVTLIHRYLAGP
jgi:thioredoxin reductase (NADPH)